MVFTGLLVTQVLIDKHDSNAVTPSVEKSSQKHYETLFRSYEFTDTTSHKFKLADMKSPIVIVNFWASWCLPCLEELPGLVELRKKIPESELQIFAVNADMDEQDKMIAKIIEKYKLNFPVIPDKSSKILGDFIVNAVPVSIIFNHGKIVQVKNGTIDFSSEEFIASIKKLINPQN